MFKGEQIELTAIYEYCYNTAEYTETEEIVHLKHEEDEYKCLRLMTKKE